jgi:AcrR family transcriptional regulator
VSSDTPSKRRRDPVRSRARILEAARQAFTERGYDKATIRDIADRAGVATGLVMRHFTNKRSLFLAAFPGPEDLTPVAAGGDRDRLIADLMGKVFEQLDSRPPADPFLALIRSAGGNQDAATALYQEMRQRTASALKAGAEPSSRELRIDLLGAQVIGIAFVRHILRAGELAAMPANDLVQALVPIVYATLYGESSSPTDGSPGRQG